MQLAEGLFWKAKASLLQEVFIHPENYIMMLPLRLSSGMSIKSKPRSFRMSFK